MSAEVFAGVVPQNHWNGISTLAGQFTGAGLALEYGVGQASPATLSYTGNDSWNAGGSSTEGDYRMMHGILKAAFNANETATFTLDNLPRGKYSVLVYTNINGGTSSQADFTLGTTTYFAEIANGFGGSYIQAQSTDGGARDTFKSNFVRWDNVVVDASGDLSFSMAWRGGNDGAGIAGFQLLAMELDPTTSLTWTGAASNSWTIGGATNFKTAADLAATYNDDAGSEFGHAGFQVLFDDTAAADKRNVTIASGGAGVKPQKLTVNTATNYTIGGDPIVGAITTVVKQGTGTLTLTGTNTYGGETQIREGIVAVNSVGTSLEPGALGTGTIVLGGTGTRGTLQYNGTLSETEVDRVVRLEGGGGTIAISNNTLGFTGPLNGSGVLTKAGNGEVEFSNTGLGSNFSGGFEVLNGRLAIARMGAGTGADKIVLGGVDTAGTFDYTGGSLKDNRGLQINSGTGTFSVSSETANLTLKGNTSGGAGAVLRKTGLGTLTLAGQVNLAAAPVISEGTLAFTNGAGTNVLPAGAITVGSGATLSIVPKSIGTSSVALNGGVLTLDGEGGALDTSAGIASFNGDGTGFTLNGATGLPSVAGNVLTLTTATNSLANSIFYNTALDITNFAVVFDYKNNMSGGAGADGFTFTLQNSGLNALGGAGGGLGYGGMANSAALGFRIYQYSATNALINGNVNNVAPSANTGEVDLRSGHPIRISLSYDGTTLTQTMLDLTTNGTFTTTYAADLASLLGGSTALIGFTGGTGGENALQEISNFSFGVLSGNQNYGTNVSVTGDSSIDVKTLTKEAVLGEVTFANGSTLHVNGVSDLRFGSTTLGANASVTLDVESKNLRFGAITGNFTSLTKQGDGRIVFEAGATTPFTGAGANIAIEGGTVVAVGDSTAAVPNPLGTASVNFAAESGGVLLLSSRNGDISYGTNISVPTDKQGTIIAGNGGAGSLNDRTVTLTGARTVEFLGRLNLRTMDGYTLRLAGTSTGSGSVHVTGGNVVATTNTILATHDVAVDAGTLRFNTSAPTIQSLAGNSRSASIILGDAATPANTALKITGSAETQYMGSIADAAPNAKGSIVYAGSGKLTLAGVNTHTGGTRVESGTLTIAISGAAGTGAIDLAGGTLQLPKSGLLGQYYSGQGTNVEGSFRGSYEAYTNYFAGRSAPSFEAQTTTAGRTNLDFNNNNGGNNPPFADQGFFDADELVARFSGTIYIPEAGTIRFATRSDDGSVVFIDGQKVVNNVAYQGMTTRGSGDPDQPNQPIQPASPLLSAGVHTIDLAFFEGTGGAGLIVYYRPAGALQDIVIPNSVLGDYYGMNPVNVIASSTLDPQGGNSRLGPLTVSTGATMTVLDGRASFTSTALPAGVSNFVKEQGELILGQVTTGGGVTINKAGTGALVFDYTGGPQFATGTNTFNVNAGRIVAIGSGSTNPLGNSKVNLNGGELMLGTKGGAATFSTQVDLLSDSTISAGKAGDLAVENGMVSMVGALNVPAGKTLNAAAYNGYVLALEGNGAGALGTLSVNAGRVALVGGAGTSPIGNMPILLNGGELGLSTSGGDFTFNTPVTVQRSSSIIAQQAGNTGVAGPVTVTLGQALNVPANTTLGLGSEGQYTLRVGGTATGSGNVSVKSGTVLSSTDTAFAGLGVGMGTGAGTRTLRFTTNAPKAAALMGGSPDSVMVLAGTGGTTLTINGTGTGNFRGTITEANGVGRLVKDNTGTLILSGENTFTGGITVNGGVLELGKSSGLTGAAAGSGVVTLAGGTLQFSNPGLQGRFYDLGAPNVNNSNPNFDSFEAMNRWIASLTPKVVKNTATDMDGNPVVSLSFNPASTDDPAPEAEDSVERMFRLYGFNNADNIVSHMAGKITIEKEGSYTFGTTSDDGSVIYIDGQLVVNNNFFQGATRREATVELTPGVHEIVIGYYEGGGGNSLIVDWSGPDFARQTLPNSVLSTVEDFHAKTDVNLTADAAIDPRGGSAVLGTLNIPANLLPTTPRVLTIGSGLLQFNSTTLATGGTYTFDKAEGDFIPGTITAGAVTINKRGAGNLVLDSEASQLNAEGTVLNILAGKVAAVYKGLGKPLGTAQINLNGGGLAFSSTVGDVTFDNALNIVSNGSITAGRYGSGDAGNPTLVTLTKPVTIGSGQTLTTSTTDNYQLVIEKAVSGGGSLVHSHGSTVLESTANLQTLTVNGGTLAAKGNLTVANGTSVNSGATLQFAGGGEEVTYSGNLNVNGGTIVASTGITKLGDNVTVAARNVTTATGELRGSIYSNTGSSGPTINKTAGLQDLLSWTPTATANLNASHSPEIPTLATPPANFPAAPNDGKLFFGQLYEGDNKFSAFFGGAGVDSFVAAFTGKFTPTENGAHGFGFSMNDDGAAFWVDLNHNGIFELDGSAGSERIANGDGCCGNADPTVSTMGTVNLIAGESYNIALVLKDTGGGSSVAGRFSTPSIAETFINPGQEPGLWSSETVSGGGKFRITADAEMHAGSIQGASSITMAGGGNTLKLTAAGQSSTVIFSTEEESISATVDLAAGHTLTAENFVNADGTTLVKTGAGNLVATHQSLGAGSVLQIDGGSVTLNGGIGASNGQLGNSGSVVVNNGALRVNGAISGSVTVASNGLLGGSGAVGEVTLHGGVIAPGNSAGTLTMKTLTVDGGTLALELLAPGQGDRIRTSAFTLTSDLQITIDLGFNPFLVGATDFLIVDNLGPDAIAGLGDGSDTPGNFLFKFGTNRLAQDEIFLVNGIEVKINYFGGTGNDVILTAIPEPGTIGALLCGAASLLGMRRFRRRQA